MLGGTALPSPVPVGTLYIVTLSQERSAGQRQRLLFHIYLGHGLILRHRPRAACQKDSKRLAMQYDRCPAKGCTSPGGQHAGTSVRDLATTECLGGFGEHEGLEIFCMGLLGTEEDAFCPFNRRSRQNSFPSSASRIKFNVPMSCCYTAREK